MLNKKEITLFRAGKKEKLGSLSFRPITFRPVHFVPFISSLVHFVPFNSSPFILSQNHFVPRSIRPILLVDCLYEGESMMLTVSM